MNEALQSPEQSRVVSEVDGLIEKNLGTERLAELDSALSRISHELKLYVASLDQPAAEQAFHDLANLNRNLFANLEGSSPQKLKSMRHALILANAVLQPDLGRMSVRAGGEKKYALGGFSDAELDKARQTLESRYG